jgi:hypothetical protein
MVRTYPVASVTNGAAGGPRIVMIPGPEGIASPMRTSGWPLLLAWLGVSGPIGITYGNPQTELIMLQIEPGSARGMPFAVGPPGGIIVIVPVSGGPERPGESITAQPIVTGGPGIFPFTATKRHKKHKNHV